jgi:hypothetical protein
VTDARSVTVNLMVVDSYLVKPLHPNYYPADPQDTAGVQVFSPRQTPEGILATIGALISVRQKRALSQALENGTRRMQELPRVVYCRDIVGTAHVRPKFVEMTAKPTIFSRCVPRSCLDMPVRIIRDGAAGAAGAAAPAFRAAPFDLFAFERAYGQPIEDAAGALSDYVPASYRKACAGTLIALADMDNFHRPEDDDHDLDIEGL